MNVSISCGVSESIRARRDSKSTCSKVCWLNAVSLSAANPCRTYSRGELDGRKNTMKQWFAMAGLLFCADGFAVETVFYLHGQIIESEGVQPVHERFGLYDFNGIVEALEGSGAEVIAAVRNGNTNVAKHAQEVADQIEALIESGTDASDITVIGFSKGGAIAITVSSVLNRPNVNFVFLAACSGWISSYPELRVSGNILSIYEKTDSLAGSCRSLIKRSEAVSSFKEVRLATRKEHGAFYLPRGEWVGPLLAWIEEVKE